MCANCGGGKLAQAAKDNQRDTMYNTLRYTIQIVTQSTVEHSSYINATTGYLIE